MSLNTEQCLVQMVSLRVDMYTSGSQPREGRGHWEWCRSFLQLTCSTFLLLSREFSMLTSFLWLLYHLLQPAIPNPSPCQLRTPILLHLYLPLLQYKGGWLALCKNCRLHQPVLYGGHRTCSKALCALKLISLSFLSQLIQSQIYFSFPHL